MDIAGFVERNPALVIGAIGGLALLIVVGRGRGSSGGQGNQFTGTVTELDPRSQSGISYVTPDELLKAQQALYERITREQAARYTESRPLIEHQAGYY